MNQSLIALWLTLPVAAYAYHMGPGQEHMRLDEVAALIESADFHVAEAERIAAIDGDEADNGGDNDADVVSLLNSDDVRWERCRYESHELRRFPPKRGKFTPQVSRISDLYFLLLS